MKRFLNISLMCIAMLHGVIGYGQICSQSLVSNSIIFDDTLQLCENNDIIVKVRLDSCDSVSGCNELCEQYSHIWLRNGLLLFDYSVDSLVVNSPGNYCLKTVWFHQNGQNTCYCDTLQSTFTVLAPPVPIIIPDIFACLGDTLSFQGVNLSNWDTLNFYSNDIELSLPIAVDSTLLLEVLGVNRFGCQTSDVSLVTPLNSGLIADNKAVCYGEEGWVIESVEDAFMNSQQINLQWQYSQDGLGWSDITGANSQSFIPVPPVAFATGQFRRMAEYVLDGLSCPSNACDFVVLGNSIPEAGPDQTLCEGQIIDLTPENCVSCAWSNGVVTGSLIAQDEILVLTDNRIFEVFDDTVSCVYIDSLEVTIVNMDAGEIAANQVLCYGQPMLPIESVQDAFGDGQYQLNWQLTTDGIVWSNIESEFNQSLSLSTEVTQDVVFRREVSTIVNEVGCSEVSNSVNIHVLGDSSAHVFAGEDLTICQGQPVILNPQGCEIYEWANDVVSGSVLSEDELLVVTGTNNFTYANEMFSCSDSDSLYATVVNVNPGTIASNQVLCYGQPVQPFESVEDAAGDGEVLLSWQNSSDGIQWFDLEIGAEQNYNYPIAAENNMSFRRVITATLNESVCQRVSNLVFVSVPNGELLITGPDSEICRNSSFVYLASNAENSNCSWSIDGGEVMSIAQNGMAVFIHQGYGDSSVVTLNATHVLSGCTQTVDYVLYASEGEASDTVNVFVLDAIDHLLTFTPAIPESLISWGYSDPNGTVIADQLSSSQFCYYETLDPESYVYWVEITNSEGCTTRSYLNFANQLVGVSNTDLTPSPTILPNPFMNECTIFNPTQSMLRITVVDAMGRFIEQMSLLPLQTIQMGSNWNSGIHIIQTVNQDGANFVFRAIKN